MKLKSKDFNVLRSIGRTYKTQSFLFVYHLHPKEAVGLKYGFTVTRKIGHACTRNRIKRLLRESLRQYFTENNDFSDTFEHQLLLNIVCLNSSKKDFNSMNYHHVFKQVEKFFKQLRK